MLYENNWESLNTRPVPAWFGEAKFGIFIHWGLYSVPAFSDKNQYAEWYGMQINDENHPAREFHDRVYGKDFRYADFVDMFKAELFDADEWAELFRDSGARYINLVSKHHDGFCMYKNPYSPFWNSVDVGPHRDFCAELKEAVEKVGIRFGVYHSVYEWWNPIAQREGPEAYALRHLIPSLKYLIETYQPNTLFTDGEWEQPSSVWHATDFLTWLYNESSVRDFIVPNDRWGKETRGLMGGNFTTEYGEVGWGRKIENSDRPFEENRGIGHSYGYNRAEEPEDYQSVHDLIGMLCSLVSKGGNFLLNVGPRADGRIPEIMKERILGMGKWIKVNGEAIYGSRVYRAQNTGDIYYTQNDSAVYAITGDYPCGCHILSEIPYRADAKVSLLGCDSKVSVFDSEGKLGVDIPFMKPSELSCTDYYTFKILK